MVEIIKRIILFAENKPDIRELNKELLEGLEMIFVKDYEKIYEMPFKKLKFCFFKRIKTNDLVNHFNSYFF